MDDKFKQAQDQYFILKGQLATGRITRQKFESALKDLTVQDARGRSWMLRADDAKWLMYDGKSWIEATPPATNFAPPTTLPELDRQTTAATRPARGGSRKWVLALGSVFVVCVIVLLGVGIFVSQGNVNIGMAPAPTLAPIPIAGLTPTPSAFAVSSTPTTELASSKVQSIKASAVSVVTPAPIAAKDFAALNALLAAKIAAMNQAQLKLIRDLRALSYNGRIPGLAAPLAQKGSALTDQEMKDLAGKAMDVAILAEDLGNVAGKQDKGSKSVAQSADTYMSIARTAWALALESQTMRQALQPLQNGSKSVSDMIDTIASYGAQLWNSTVTDGNSKNNPFTAQTKNGGESPTFLNSNTALQAQAQVNANNSSIWVAQSSTQNMRTIDVPAAKSPVTNPFDPQVKNSLTTADGQNDANKSQQVAAANLQRLGATSNSSDPSKPSQLQVPTNPVAVASGDQIKAGNLPTFKSGKATVVSKDDNSDDPFVQALGLNGDQTPTDQGKTTVQDAPALVGLSITNIVLTNVNKRAPGSGTFEADVNFSFTANWTTNLAAPQFTLSCNNNNSNGVSQTSGSLNLSGNGLLILYPGTLTVYCYASSTNGQTLGSTSVNVLVGDAADATKRAQQVETDSAILNVTLTAEAQGTQSAQQTQTAIAVATQKAAASQTAQAAATINALETEVAADKTVEFKKTAAAFATQQAKPPPPTAKPTATQTFTPKVVDQLSHPGNVDAVSTHVVLQRGRLYRFTFSGRVNVINPSRSLTAGQLPDRVNGVAVPANGIIVVQGTGGVATITCGHEVPDPKDPGAYGIVVEDLGPM